MPKQIPDIESFKRSLLFSLQAAIKESGYRDEDDLWGKTFYCTAPYHELGNEAIADWKEISLLVDVWIPEGWLRIYFDLFFVASQTRDKWGNKLALYEAMC